MWQARKNVISDRQTDMSGCILGCRVKLGVKRPIFLTANILVNSLEIFLLFGGKMQVNRIKKEKGK